MSTETTTQDTNADSVGEKFLTFYLSDEEYGLPIMSVREIIGVLKITPVPNTPSYVQGVINLRGKIIPVIDIRHRFGMTPVEVTKETCIIVVQTGESDRGILVDRVSDVANIPESQIDTPPQFREDVEADLIQGVGKSGDRVTLILNTDKALDMRGAVDCTEVEEQAC